MDVKESLGCVVFDGREYSSEYIMDQIENIRMLIQRQQKKNNIGTMGILLRRGPLLIAAMLGALLEHVPFFLVDSSMPKKRIGDMLSIGEIDWILSQEEMRSFPLGLIPVTFYEACKTTDRDVGRMESNELESFREADEEELAYLLFTSGSTGVPKAVEVRRRGLLHFLYAVPKRIPFQEKERIACITSVSFDIFFLESLLGILNGMTVVMLSEEEASNPKKILEVLKKNKIDTIQITPSRLKVLSLYDKHLCCLREAKRILVGGESFPTSLLRLLQKETVAEIYNMYGPTETTIWSTISDLTKKDAIDIGEPVGDTTIFILDEEGNQLPSGMQGEICIGGEGIARGYRNAKEQTEKAFTDLPGTNIRIYKTGDQGMYGESGSLLCLGRNDNQIKRMGYRIELDEIDNDLFELPELQLSVTCYPKEDNPNDDLITFYLADDWIPVKTFHEYLGRYLPTYMMPSTFTRVSKVLYTKSGKADRRAMLNAADEITCVRKAEKDDEEDKPNDTTYITIKEIVMNNIGEKEEITSSTNLFEMGMNSIEYASIMIQMEEYFDMEFDSEMSMANTSLTIQDLVDYVTIKAID